MKKILFLMIFFVTSNLIIAQEQVWFAKGEKAYNKKEYRQAVNNFNQVLQKNPKNKDAYYMRGLSLLFLNEADSASKDFSETIKLDPNNIDAYNNRGLCYGYLGEIDLSIDDFKKAISLDKKFAQAYLNLGSAFLAIQDYQSAKETLNKVVKLDSTNPENYFQRGSAFLFLKEYQKGLADFTKAIDMGLTISKSYFNRASCNFKLENYSAAISDLNIVLEKDSADIEALSNRSVCYEKMGLIEKADEDKIKIYVIQSGLDQLKNLKDIDFKKFTFFEGKISFELPSNWVFNSDTTTYGEVAVTSHDSIKSINDYYLVGVRMAIDTNMFVQYKVKTVEEILGFWEHSSQMNEKTYKEVEEHISADIQKAGYQGYMRDVSIIVDDNSFPIRMFEIVLVKDDKLFYAYYQCPPNLFNLLKDLFIRSFDSLEINL